MARSSSLRASDADRDAVAERLRQAAVEGRLEPHELEDRLHTALRARTYGELDRVLSDLPRRSPPARPRSRSRPAIGIAGLLLVAMVRLVVVLLLIAALVTALAVTAAWWIIGIAVFWISMHSRRSCAGWQRPPSRRVYQ